ncbi:putative mitochondrial import protein [Clavispora lusitaniae]|uniref:Mitochondrial import protein n=2 Tax=Clavispora lusitaniae TaxID=36911 RepID=A0AA91PX26_CLALS|nr:hypothetical protein E0198_004957 [Clavispora lusitaniae]KAF7581069.1 Outer membrane protein TOM13 family protein [Clavispora lusitaniae]OVF06915.1 putative mitochondrial import protein [Clavispora lusitaniae]QFZ29958.1 putative mitochondrial import protein [Clavispora lusitaniae]QFZ35622.1 putative mitochondrial import protein [Clavispora lusitaniae]
MSLSIDPALIRETEAAVAMSQMSTEDLVSNEDISNTHNIILEGRKESQEIIDDIDDVDEADTIVPFSLFDLLRKSAVNLFLPFINGIMLGFGEIFAHEIGFKYGFVGAKVYPPQRQLKQKPKYI